MKKRASHSSKGKAITSPASKNPVQNSENVSIRPASAVQITAAENTPRWTFLTNHSHVLVLLFQHPEMTLRQVALQIGITERAVQRIIAELEEAGIIKRKRIGRNNNYSINNHLPLRHPIECHRNIGELLALCARDNGRDLQKETPAQRPLS